MTMQLTIVCVDDQRDVLSSIVDDLAFFQQYVRLEECESAEEALSIMDECDADGHHIAVILSDQVMPKISGVEFLMSVSRDPRFTGTKKVLLTGQATHQDTIIAINSARIDAYIEKPWQSNHLELVVKQLITEYVFENGLCWQNWQPILDADGILKYHHLT